MSDAIDYLLSDGINNDWWFFMSVSVLFTAVRVAMDVRRDIRAAAKNRVDADTPVDAVERLQEDIRRWAEGGAQ